MSLPTSTSLPTPLHDEWPEENSSALQNSSFKGMPSMMSCSTASRCNWTWTGGASAVGVGTAGAAFRLAEAAASPTQFRFFGWHSHFVLLFVSCPFNPQRSKGQMSRVVHFFLFFFGGRASFDTMQPPSTSKPMPGTQPSFSLSTLLFCFLGMLFHLVMEACLSSFLIFCFLGCHNPFRSLSVSPSQAVQCVGGHTDS